MMKLTKNSLAVFTLLSATLVALPCEAGGRYSKVDGLGNALPDNAGSWSCVRDNQTGALWEEKTADGGLRDKDGRYRHFHNSAGYASTVDYNGNVLCQGLESCDAYSYVNAVNGTGLCGRNNWRLPLPGELLNLAQFNGAPPHIDMSVFPETVNQPGLGSYCTENMKMDEYGNRHEENYQGVDFSLPVYDGNLGGSLIFALRFSGEVPDGLSAYPNANWICHTRLISN